jgi:serine/threonine-protein kinase
MGEVYGAYDPSLDRLVALKTIVAGSDNPMLVERLQREARACGRLDHQGIVKVHDLGESGGTIFIAMEWLKGESLADAMNGGGLTFGNKLKILIEILDALAYAHGEGIIHRDIKPSNVWLTPTGSVKLLDFGLARLAQADGLTLPGEVMGTPYYMSPEQLKGHPVDGRTDVFSTGVLGYELLARRRAFDGDSITAIIIKVLGETPPPLGTAWSAAFPEVDAIIGKAIAKLPDDRYRTASEMAVALRAFMETHRAAIARVEQDLSGASRKAISDAATLLAQGLPDQATAMLTDALRRDPDSTEIRTLLAAQIGAATAAASGRAPSTAPVTTPAPAATTPPAAADVTAPLPAPTAFAPDPAPASRPYTNPALTPPVAVNVPSEGSRTATVPRPLLDRAGGSDRSGSAVASDGGRPRKSWVWPAAAAVVILAGAGVYFGLSSSSTATSKETSQPTSSSNPAPGTNASVTPTPTAGSNGAASQPSTPVGAPPPSPAPQPAASTPSPAPEPTPPEPSTASSRGQTRADPLPGRRGGPQGPLGPRGGVPGQPLSGFIITAASRPPMPVLLGSRLVQQGFTVADRLPDARWAITATGDVTVRPAAVGAANGAITADYKGEVTVLDRQHRRSDSREFDGQVLAFGEAAARQDAVKKLADRIAEFVSELMKSR